MSILPQSTNSSYFIYGGKSTVNNGIVVGYAPTQDTQIMTIFKNWTSWTPTVDGAAQATIISSDCQYTQFGNTVYITINLDITKTTSTTALIQLSGLPSPADFKTGLVLGGTLFVSENLTAPALERTQATVLTSGIMTIRKETSYTNGSNYRLRFSMYYYTDEIFPEVPQTISIERYNRIKVAKGITFASFDTLLKYTGWRSWTPAFSAGSTAIISTTGTIYRQFGNVGEIIFSVAFTAAAVATATMTGLPVAATTGNLYVATITLNNTTAGTHQLARITLNPAVSTTSLTIEPISGAFLANNYLINSSMFYRYTT
jgi:hypothetical protein